MVALPEGGETPNTCSRSSRANAVTQRIIMHGISITFSMRILPRG